MLKSVYCQKKYIMRCHSTLHLYFSLTEINFLGGGSNTVSLYRLFEFVSWQLTNQGFPIFSENLTSFFVAFLLMQLHFEWFAFNDFGIMTARSATVWLVAEILTENIDRRVCMSASRVWCGVTGVCFDWQKCSSCRIFPISGNFLNFFRQHFPTLHLCHKFNKVYGVLTHLPIFDWRCYSSKYLYLSSLDFIAFYQHFVQYNLVTDNKFNPVHVWNSLISSYKTTYIVLIRMDF